MRMPFPKRLPPTMHPPKEQKSNNSVCLTTEEDEGGGPVKTFLEHLEEIEGFKLRVGDYRLIIDVDNTAKTLTILKAGHRKNVYES